MRIVLPISSRVGLLAQQTPPLGHVALGPQPNPAGGGLGRPLALAGDHRRLAALGLFPRACEPVPLALARGPLAAPFCIGGPPGRCHRRAQRRPPSRPRPGAVERVA